MSATPVTPDQYIGPSAFVSTHSHSIYSTLDGVASPQQYADECRSRQWPAMAITEHGNLASIPDLLFSFKKAGVKAIAGNEIYYNDDHRQAIAARDAGLSAQRANQSDDPEVWDQYIRYFRSRHLTVLAKNQQGFENLLRMQTDANRDGTWRTNRPGRVWFERLAQYREGLIVLSGCLNGPVAHELRRRRLCMVETEFKGKVSRRVKEQGEFYPRGERMQQARQLAQRFQQLFGEDYLMELQMPVIRDAPAPGAPSPYRDGLVDLEVWHDSIELADELGLELVLSNDCHYIKKQDALLQKLMMAIEQDVEIDSPDLFASGTGEQYLKTRGELWATFRNHGYSAGVPDSLFERMCDNTLMVAERCRPLKIDSSPKMPQIVNADQELRDMVHRELRRRGFDRDPRKFMIDGREVTYTEQAEIELQRFIDKGFSSYFVITADLVRWGRAQGYPFCPRGSAGGSLVCFLLGIHTLNSCLWGLSFDRFLSPARGGFMLNVRMPEPVN